MFLTRSRPIDFTFSSDFSILKCPFAHQLDFYGNSVAKNTSIQYLSKNTILHFSIKYEFETERFSCCIRSVFITRFYFFLLKMDHFWGFNAFLNKKNLKGNFSNYLGRKICRLFHFLAQLLCTTSETGLHYYH